MTSCTPWLGSKRVAFVPVYRPHAVPPDVIPSDWENLILRRVLYNPRTEVSGADRSLRAWVRAASSGRADIDPLVMPMQTVDKQEVPPDELEATLGDTLRAQGAIAAQLVMLGGKRTGISRGFWSRVAMAESNGVWLMEMMHTLTRMWDLYHFNNDVDPVQRDIAYFDEMSSASQTHPTSYSKNEYGWLDTSYIPIHPYHAGASADYTLQYVSLSQPPQAGNVAAVRIGYGIPYVIVEARKKTDQFETGMPSTGDPQEFGISSEGAIAYRVQTHNPTQPEREGNKKPLFLMTLTALNPGETAQLDHGVTLRVSGAHADGLTVNIKNAPLPPDVMVPGVIGVNARVARQAIAQHDLVPIFHGSQVNTVVVSQSPEGGEFVPRQSKVRLEMGEAEP